MGKVKTSIALDSAVLERLKAKAAAERRSVSSLVDFELSRMLGAENARLLKPQAFPEGGK